MQKGRINYETETFIIGNALVHCNIFIGNKKPGLFAYTCLSGEFWIIINNNKTSKDIKLINIFEKHTDFLRKHFLNKCKFKH